MVGRWRVARGGCTPFTGAPEEETAAKAGTETSHVGEDIDV